MSQGNVEMNSKSLDVLQTFLHIKDGGKSSAIPVSDTFWKDLAGGAYPELEHGRLLSAFTFSEPWPVWECHPAGEEIVMLLSGSVVMVLESEGGEKTVPLSKTGAFVVVPAGVWHTARASEVSTLLFLTPGAGTQHKPV